MPPILGESDSMQDDSEDRSAGMGAGGGLTSYIYSSVSSTDTRELLDHIRRRDNMVIRATSDKSTTWIKPREGLVYINYPRESVPGFDSWTWIATDHNDIPDNARKLQFDLWLFESLWQSNMDGRHDIDDHAYYRLIRDKIGVFYCFYLFLGSWHKNCYKDR